MKMNSWDKNRNTQIYKQKLQSVKSTMAKSKKYILKNKHILTFLYLVFTSPQSQTLALKKKSPVLKTNINVVQINQMSSSTRDNSNGMRLESGRLESYQKQQGLKRLLREFGLQQYLRVKRIF
jgi:hypothetical protein